MNTLQTQVAALVEAASDGDVRRSDVMAPGASLSAAGLGSLGFLRLIDAIEREFGVEIDPDGDFSELDGVEVIAEQLARLGVPADGPPADPSPPA